MSVSPQLESLLSLPGLSSAGGGVVEEMTLVDTSGLLASSSETTGFTVLVNRLADPVVSGITSDGLVLRVDKNDLEELVCGVLVDPVRVKDTQVRSTTSDTLLSSSTKSSLVLELVDTHVGWLTVGGTLWCRLLTVTSADTDSVDDESLLGLVSETSSLVWTRRSRSAVADVLLSVFPTSHSQQETEDVTLLVALDFFQVLVGAHCLVGGCRRYYLVLVQTVPHEKFNVVA